MTKERVCVYVCREKEKERDRFVHKKVVHKICGVCECV